MKMIRKINLMGLPL
jgi:hypothetical protein